MKHNHVLAVIAAIVLGLTGLAAAQQGYFNAEEGNGKWGAEPAVSPADTGYAYFNSEIANSAPLNVQRDLLAVHEHAGKSGTLKIAADTNVGGVVLKPGEYEVRHVDTGDKHFVEFAQTVENDYVLEGQTVYSQEVVARVNCTREPLESTVARTELLPKTAGTTARLEIRGEKVVHEF